MDAEKDQGAEREEGSVIQKHATMEYYLCCQEIDLLACHDKWENVMQQQSAESSLDLL